MDSGITFDSNGDLLFSDRDNHIIRKIRKTDGKIQTIIGNRTQCISPWTACGDGTNSPLAVRLSKVCKATRL